MTLEQALRATLEDPAHNRHYIYAARPFTLTSPAFIERRATLGWNDTAYDGTMPMGVEVMAYVKDIRHEYLRHADHADALARLVAHYEAKKETADL